MYNNQSHKNVGQSSSNQGSPSAQINILEVNTNQSNQMSSQPQSLAIQDNMQGTTPTVAETGRSPITQSPGMNIMSTLKASFPLLSLAMETVVDQIQQRLKPNSDEDIYRLIVALLNDVTKNTGTR
nr:8710_t:CDS:2 [Entrophospora candida]